MYVPSPIRLNSPCPSRKGEVSISSPRPPVFNLYWHFRIRTAASGWKRVGTDAWPNDEPAFHIPGMVRFFLVTFASKLVRRTVSYYYLSWITRIPYITWL